MSWWELRVWLWRMRRRVGVWGYFLEAVVWLRTAFLRRTPGTRLVIFAQGRTGSELLCDLLHSHSLIHCDKEILNQPVLSPYGHIRRCALSSTKNTYGFKVKIDQLTQRQKVRDVKAFLTRLHEEGWKIIYLSRRNLLRHALSDVLRVRSGKAHRYRSRDGAQPKVEKIPVDCESLLRGMEVRKDALLLSPAKLFLGVDASAPFLLSNLNAGLVDCVFDMKGTNAFNFEDNGTAEFGYYLGDIFLRSTNKLYFDTSWHSTGYPVAGTEYIGRVSGNLVVQASTGNLRLIAANSACEID